MMRRIPRILALGILATTELATVRAEDIPRDQRKSGYETMGPQARAIEDDDLANPASLWVLEGESLWGQPAGATQKSCADCHADARQSMRGVAARYPVVAADGQTTDLEGRIALCQSEKQQADAAARESRAMLALTAYVARQSRGMPIRVATDPATQAVVAAGRSLFSQRQGQLNLSCAQCHDDNWGRSLGGAMIPQGHPTGYPVYRLEWQALGSLQRRLRNCLVGVRAEPYPAGAPEYVALELFLKSRARDMPMDAPGVRP